MKTAKLLFNISFSFLFFSLITKVEHGKVSCDKSQSHKGVTMVMSQAIVTWRPWEIEEYSHIVIVYIV